MAKKRVSKKLSGSDGGLSDHGSGVYTRTRVIRESYDGDGVLVSKVEKRVADGKSIKGSEFFMLFDRHADQILGLSRRGLCMFIACCRKMDLRSNLVGRNGILRMEFDKLHGGRFSSVSSANKVFYHVFQELCDFDLVRKHSVNGYMVNPLVVCRTRISDAPELISNWGLLSESSVRKRAREAKERIESGEVSEVEIGEVGVVDDELLLTGVYVTVYGGELIMPESVLFRYGRDREYPGKLMFSMNEGVLYANMNNVGKGNDIVVMPIYGKDYEYEYRVQLPHPVQAKYSSGIYRLGDSVVEGHNRWVPIIYDEKVNARGIKLFKKLASRYKRIKKD